jgi:hypothetical protein
LDVNTLAVNVILIWLWLFFSCSDYREEIFALFFFCSDNPLGISAGFSMKRDLVEKVLENRN